MTDPELTYVGPLPKLPNSRPSGAERWRRLPWAFIIVVVLPTVLAAVYFLLIASPRYVSEARFIVRSPNSASTPSAFGVALQGVGISAGQTDSFAVHEYMTSQDGVRDLERRFDFSKIFGPAGADVFSKFPRPGESRTVEGKEKALERFVTVGYDSTTGISTLRVEAFRPKDAQAVNLALLDGGERLVNRLNQRSARNAVLDATRARDEAERRLASDQQALLAFRNRERLVDPVRAATESSQLVGSLLASVAEIRAEREQIASQAPDSPQLPALDARIGGLQRQIEAERNRSAGDSSSLAPKIGIYEELSMRRDLTAEELAKASTVLLAAEQDARRQQLYLERIVSPSLPEQPLEPRRWLAILAVFGTTILAFGIGWLVWAGVREHRQD